MVQQHCQTRSLDALYYMRPYDKSHYKVATHESEDLFFSLLQLSKHWAAPYALWGRSESEFEAERMLAIFFSKSKQIEMLCKM